MKQKVIGLVGLIGSGKSTVGNYLMEKHGFQSVSFASNLKDAVSAIFGWPRHLLEGDTKESREWREQRDDYWSMKMGKTITPRYILQQIGTDVLRKSFQDEIWIWSLEKKIAGADRPTVITDVRFPNEVKMLKSIGADILWIRRAGEPVWLYTAMHNKNLMPTVYPEVHSSEYAWLGVDQYIEVRNNGTIEDLHKWIDSYLEMNPPSA